MSAQNSGAPTFGGSTVFMFWPENEDWSWHFLRPLAESTFGGGEAQECLRAAARITPGDNESWYAEWSALAEQIAGAGEEALTRGRTVTARDHLHRAFCYYRWAEYFLGAEDPRRIPTYRKAVDCFRKAGPYMDPPLEQVEIPYEGSILHGHFYRGESAPDEKTPGTLYIAGADVLKEELYFLGGKALIERGISLLVADYPGQGESLRFQKLYSRPDFEVPISAALEVLASRPEVDENRLGVIGRSFGGYYGPRAAAFDSRIRALVVFGALYAAVEFFDDYPLFRGQLQWLTGSNSPEETRKKLLQFDLDDVIGQVQCPILVIHGEVDHLIPASHAHRTYNGVGSEDKELLLYPADEPGGVHCQYDNFPNTIPYFCDWLAERLRA